METHGQNTAQFEIKTSGKLPTVLSEQDRRDVHVLMLTAAEQIHGEFILWISRIVISRLHLLVLQLLFICVSQCASVSFSLTTGGFCLFS